MPFSGNKINNDAGADPRLRGDKLCKLVPDPNLQSFARKDSAGAGAGVIKIKQFTIFTEPLCEGGVLKFADSTHLINFLTQLKARCKKENLSDLYGTLYNNSSFKKYRDDISKCGRCHTQGYKLELSMACIEKDDSSPDMFARVKRFKKIAAYIHKITLPKNVKIFARLKDTDIHNWPPNEKREFFAFCRNNMNRNEYNQFAAQIKGAKINLPAWDQIDVWCAEINICNPGKLAAEIQKHVILGPAINVGICPKSRDIKGQAPQNSSNLAKPDPFLGSPLQKFLAPHRKEIAEGKLVEAYVYLDNKTDAQGVLIPRLCLIPNKPFNIAYFQQLKARHFVYAQAQNIFSPQAVRRVCNKLDEWNILERGFSYIDLALIPALSKINNEIGRSALLEIYGVIMVFRQLCNPISLVRFFAGLSLLGEDITRVIQVWKYGTSAERALAVGSIIGILFGPKAFKLANKFFADSVITFQARKIMSGSKIQYYTIVQKGGKVYSIIPNKKTGFVTIIRDDGTAVAFKKGANGKLTVVPFKATKGNMPKNSAVTARKPSSATKPAYAQIGRDGLEPAPAKAGGRPGQRAGTSPAPTPSLAMSVLADAGKRMRIAAAPITRGINNVREMINAAAALMADGVNNTAATLACANGLRPALAGTAAGKLGQTTDRFFAIGKPGGKTKTEKPDNPQSAAPAAAAYNKTTLPNGLKFITETNPDTEFVAIGVFVDAGSAIESPAERGISHFLEHMAFKGTRNYSEEKLHDTLRGITPAAGYNAYTSQEHTCYHLKVMKKDLPKALELLEEIIFKKRFEERDVETEKGTILDELRRSKDSNTDEALENLLKIIFPDSGLGKPVIGCETSIKSFTPDDLRNFAKRHYTPDRISLVAAGNISHGELVCLARERFARLTGKSKTIPEKAAKIIPKKAFVYKDCEEVLLTLAADGPTGESSLKENYEISVFSCILQNRLIAKLKIKNPFATTIDVSASKFKNSGIFTLFLATSKEYVNKAIAALLEEAENIKRNGITREEFNAAKRGFKISLLEDLESPLSRMIGMGQRELGGGAHKTYAESVAMLDALTLDDMAGCAGKYLDPNKYVWSFYGPVTEKDVVIPEIAAAKSKKKPRIRDCSKPADLKTGKSDMKPARRPAPSGAERRPAPSGAGRRPAPLANAKKPAAISTGPVFEKSVLPNGVRVVTETNPNTNFVSLNIYVTLGSGHDPKGYEGVNSFIVQMAARGTKKYPSYLQLSAAVQNTAAEFSAKGDKDYICFSIKTLKDELPKAMEILSELFLRKKFDPKDFEALKSNSIAFLDKLKDNPGAVSQIEFEKVLYEGSNLGELTMGNKESVARMTPDDLKRFEQEHLIPGRIIIVAAGNVSHKEIMARTKKEFGGLPEKNAPVSALGVQIKPKKVVITRDCGQVYLRIGIQSPSSAHPQIETIKAQIFCLILKERLYKKLRKESGFIYGINIHNDMFNEVGAFKISTSTSKENINKVIAMILDEIKLIKKEGLTEKEFGLVKKKIAISNAENAESPSSRSYLLAADEINGQKHLTTGELMKTIDGITLEDLNSHSRMYLDPSKYVWSIYGPVKEKDVIIPK